MRRDHLLMVRLSLWMEEIQSLHVCPKLAHYLGNDKPSTLQQVEDALLRMVINVADGCTAQDEVQKFLQEFNNMTSIWEREDRSPDEYRFFAPRAFISLDNSYNPLTQIESGTGSNNW